MSISRRHFMNIFTTSLLLLDSCGLALAFQAAFATRFRFQPFINVFPPIKGIPEFSFYQQTFYAILPAWLLVFFYTGFYKGNPASAYDEFLRILKGVVLGALLTTAMTFAYRTTDYSRLVIGLWSGYSIAFIYCLRQINKFLFHHLIFKATGRHHTLVMGKSRVVDIIQKMSTRQPYLKTVFLESLPTGTPLVGYLAEKQISEVLLIQGGVSSHAILEASQACEALNIDCKIVPDIMEMRRGEIIVDGFLGLPTFHLKPLSLHGSNYYTKRCFDVLTSLLILTIFFIPLAVISCLICLDSPGPILYCQERMGLRSRRFKFFKFRTMVSDADDLLSNIKHLSERGGPVFKMKNDPRVTRVGRWLRKYSLDEIPQILNVLKGDMSLVGPRPQVLWEAAYYDDIARKRLRIMPGITGLWQVSGRAALSFEEMIDLDIYYLENWSLGLDLKILLRTLPAIIDGKGAY